MLCSLSSPRQYFGQICIASVHTMPSPTRDDIIPPLGIDMNADGDQRVSPFPEKQMTVCAVMLALLEKGTSMLGTLNFIWATAVLLGGFVSSLDISDFFFVSILLVAEGLRIFGRRGELEVRTFTIVKIYSFFIQDFSASICIYFSTSRLKGKGAYGRSEHVQGLALSIFYWVSLVESSLIAFGLSLRTFVAISPLSLHLVENYPSIFVSRIYQGRFFREVREKYGFCDSHFRTVHRFFYDSYSRCVSGSIFDGLKMEFVSYSVELLHSSAGDEQLMGVKLLSALVKGNEFALERLRSIGAIRDVVEMLIDMLNWGKFEFQREAAQIISNLVNIHRYRILMMSTPHSMESIASLLCKNQDSEESHYSYLSLLGFGLGILKSLANDHDNHAKIGSSKRLLVKIIRFTELDGKGAPECLQLKILAIETLTGIARDEKVRESIGGIDGVLYNFFSLFFMNINGELVSKAGEALSFLSLDNNQNCEIMMTIKLGHDFPNVIGRLISVLNDPVRGTYAARILRNLYAYAEANCVEVKEITAASAQVVGLVMERDDINQEAAIGLAAQIFKCMTKSDFDRVFNEQGAGAAIRRSLISKVLEVLRRHPSPSKKVPNMRRFSIQLLIALMVMDRSSIEIRSDLEAALEEVMKSTSVLESYSAFSGSVGLRSHRMAIPVLVQSAMELLPN